MNNDQGRNCITPDELKQLIADKKKQIQIIDVRSIEEYNDLYIPGAINIVISN